MGLALSFPKNPTQSAAGSRDYLRWLEGVRAICALYVVLHHIYIGTITDYALGGGYFYLGWLVYGQLAVVAFIVVSGFSLGLKPVQNDFKLQDGPFDFYRRRAWRILPPYWTALLLAMAYHLLFIHEDPTHAVNTRSFIVHAFLVQDIFHNNSPNGAFWSIAVEAQIYIIFPAALVFCRAAGILIAVASLSVVTVCAHVAANKIGMLSTIDHLSPQLFIAFLFGLAAAKTSFVVLNYRRLLLIGSALYALALTILLSISELSWVTPRYFWIDISFAALLALSFVLLNERPNRLRSILAWPPLVFVGTFSYSLYLTHLVILHPVLVFLRAQLSGEKLLVMMYCFGLPIALVFAFLFFYLFEKPFLSIRSWSNFVDVTLGAYRRLRGAEETRSQRHMTEI